MCKTKIYLSLSKWEANTMKKLLFVVIVLLLVVPTKTSFSAPFDYGLLYSENRYYESTNTSQYGMLGDTGVYTNEYDVFMYIPSWAGYEYQKLTPYGFLGSYGAAKFFTTADGYPPPGGAYEARDIYFFIDENRSGNIDSSDPSIYRYYQSGRFSQMPFVQNVKTSYSGSGVIVSWNGIPLVGDFGDDEYDQYRVRIIDKATTEILFDSGMIGINSSNKYEYNLGDLSAYGDDFWIAVEAREIIEMGTANRSRYYAEGSPVPEPTTMLLLGSGLFGFAVIGRKRFKK
jgi:hypothetical protein